MERGAERGSGSSLEARRLCIVPADITGRLLGPLRAHLEDSGIEVIGERRSDERRSSADRRKADVAELVPATGDRRRIRNAAGRRVADRRAPLTPVSPPAGLPRRARRYAERLVFVERLAPSEEELEDDDTARLVIAFQAGEREAFSTLYSRYFDRAYGYLRVVLRDRHEAEDLTQEVFLRALGALPRYERRAQPFRAWLFTIARNQMLQTLAERERVEPTENAHELLSAAVRLDPQAAAIPVPGWLSDGDLAIFIERLPESQRQALFLRFALGLSAEEVGEVMGRSVRAVHQLHSRGLRVLRERMTETGRETKRRRSRAGRLRMDGVNVLGARRFALGAGGLSFAQSRPVERRR